MLYITLRQSKKNVNLSYLALMYDNICVSFEPRVLCAVSGLSLPSLRKEVVSNGDYILER